jgi:hypothetical protein
MAEQGNPRWFLEALFAGKPDELYLLIWTLADKRSRWFRSVEEAVQCAETLRNSDAYIGVGLSRQDYGPSHRCPSSQIAGLVGLWADLDLRSDAHPKSALPATIAEALSILPRELPPSLVVATGNGAHAWWLFKETLVFDSEEDRNGAARLATRWQTLLRLNAASRGWALDRLSDLARVLRIPGSLNNKDPQNPKPVAIHSRTDRRYNPSDLGDYLDIHAIPGPDEQEHDTRTWAERLSDRPLVVDPNATVPEDLLQRLTATDMRFRNTWLRQRHDLKDQSQSGYDLALADFGFEAGFSEQQIVDMLIHHRRVNGRVPKLREDYFRRTLAKAEKHAGTAVEIPAAATFSAPPPPESTTPASDIPAEEPLDPARVKAALCERLSGILGVRILRILKITGKEPTYQLELENATVELANVTKLIDQGSLRAAIAAAADRLIPKIKPKQWEQVAQMLLDALTVTEGGEETDLRGAIKLYINHYLSETPFIPSIEGQAIQTIRKPTIINDQIAICASDLQPHINKTFGQNHSIKAVASMLAAIGAMSIRVRGARFREQSRWLLPASEFDPADYVAGAQD